MATTETIHTGTRLDLDRVPNDLTGGTLPIAPATRIGDLVLTSGLVGTDPETGQLVTESFATQAERVLENLRIVVEAAGSSLQKVAKVNVFLADIEADWATFNAIYSQYFSAPFPARTAVQSRLAFDALRIEIEAVATI